MRVGMTFNHATNSLRRISPISERSIVPGRDEVGGRPVCTTDDFANRNRLERDMPRHH